MSPAILCWIGGAIHDNATPISRSLPGNGVSSVQLGDTPEWLDWPRLSEVALHVAAALRWLYCDGSLDATTM